MARTRVVADAPDPGVGVDRRIAGREALGAERTEADAAREHADREVVAVEAAQVFAGELGAEVLGEEQFEELHLCEDCAHKYLYEPQQKAAGAKGESAPPLEQDDEPGASSRACPVCGLKFVEFRNSGRLGCPHDYQEFREELAPLLENIHGETRHVGKVPRRAPDARRGQAELIKLRKALSVAVNKEQYEEAARIRDRIKRLEEH